MTEYVRGYIVSDTVIVRFGFYHDDADGIAIHRLVWLILGFAGLDGVFGDLVTSSQDLVISAISDVSVSALVCCYTWLDSDMFIIIQHMTNLCISHVLNRAQPHV